MNDYVSKPVRVESLVAALEAAPRLDAVAGRDGVVPRSRLELPPDTANGAGSPDVNDPSALRDLQEMLGGGFASLASIIESFLAEAPTLMDQLRVAAAGRDATTVHRIAHSLKSNARDLGSQRLSTLCQDLELRAREGSLESVETDVAAIERELNRVMRALSAELAGGASEAADRSGAG
jgi:HPt (histidine-containing phosphotransfer) domain-containing protein